ncbi:hypothetical protein [Glycomyces sp. NPDC047010]|uniref:DUF1700 domain-containing protein n=1 Tax=Glycomyces sp. NPDC047010 TaxID=3155023 RepID=UPI0033FDA1FB
MTDSPRGPEAATYLAEVRRHLADLPPAAREDLLADLEAHLNEVAADLEPGATLAGRLGSPQDYAAELRETVFVEGDAPRAAPPRNPLAAARAAAVRTADRITGSAGMGTFAEFREKVRPGWWVLRGATAGVLLCYLVLRADPAFARASVGHFAATFWAVAAVALLGTWASLRLGTASTRWRPGYRYALAAGGTLVVLWAVWSAVDAVGLRAYLVQYPDAYASGVDENPYGGISDVYPYDEDGELLTDVYLLDEWGMPIYLGDPSYCAGGDPLNDSRSDPYGPDPDLGYQYPLCVPGSSNESAAPSESASEAPTDEAGGSPTTPEEGPSDPSDEPTTTQDPTTE